MQCCWLGSVLSSGFMGAQMGRNRGSDSAYWRHILSVENGKFASIVSVGGASASILGCVRNGMQFFPFASSEPFEGQRNDNIDLGDMTKGISRVGLRYYLPGLLLHFLKNGTYENSTWGPTVYFNLVRRLQTDDKNVLEFGGAVRYFGFDDTQRKHCATIMMAICDRYGDQYEEFNRRGYEWQDTARNSMKRALSGYWSSSTCSPS